MKNHRVRDALQAQGVRASLVLHREIRALDRCLLEDEAVLWATNADVTAVPITDAFRSLPFTGEEAQFGVLAVTTKRIAFSRSDVPVHQIGLDTLQDIGIERAQNGAVVRITGTAEGFLTYLLYPELEKFERAVATARVPCSDAPPVRNYFSSHEELRSLKRLFDDGIITQDEFDQKKKQLLGL